MFEYLVKGVGADLLDAGQGVTHLNGRIRPQCPGAESLLGKHGEYWVEIDAHECQPLLRQC